MTGKPDETDTEKKTVKKKTASPAPRPSRPVRPGRGRTDLALLINGVLVGIGGVFVVTASVAVTVVAAVAALTLAVVIVVTGR